MKHQFGEKLRMQREKRGLTLRQVAERAGVSESLVSQIERNRVSPAIDTLFSITETLEIDIDYLFADVRRQREVQVVRAGDRSSFSRPGVVYRRLAQLESPSPGVEGIEAYEVDIEPGSSTGSSEYGHQGSELGVVLEGRAELLVDKARHVLEPGDSASFSSDTPHILSNIGDSPLRVFWVITPPKNEVPTRS